MSARRSTPRFVAPLVLAALALTHTAAASPVFDAVGSVGGSGGAQGVVCGPGPASTYFNPALLADADDSVLVGFAVASDQVGVTLDGRRGGDVPLIVGERDAVGGDRAPIPNDVVPTPWLRDGCEPGVQSGQCPPPGFAARPRQQASASQRTRTYLVLGVARHLVEDRLSVGVYAMLPLGSFTAAQGFYPDEREAVFSNGLGSELSGDRMTAVSLAFGAAFKVLPSLSLGAGLSVSLASAAASRSYVRDTTNYDAMLLDNAVTTQVGVSPTLGVRWRPTSRVRIGGALHTPESFALDTDITATLPSGTESSTKRAEVYHWMPWRVSLGAEIDAISHGSYALSVAASFRYAYWSAYLDRHGQNPAEVYGAAFGFSDTLSGAIGVRHTWKNRGRLFVDFTYVPTPVPLQVGRSSYVDNDRVGVLAGGELSLHLGGLEIRPGVQVFAHRLVRRYAHKDDRLMRDELPDDAVLGATGEPVPGAAGLQTNSPGWPGFASGGWLSGGAVTLTLPL